MRLDLEQVNSEDHSAVVYFAPAEGEDAPEFLLFEEISIVDNSWRERASEKGRRLWQRTKLRFESIHVDIFAGDRFVSRMDGIKRLTVLLKQPVEKTVVLERLHKIFKDRSYKHLRWMIIDLLLLPLTLLFMPLPGPNLPGYYLLFRVYSHWKSFRSATAAGLQNVDLRVTNEAVEVSAFLRKSKDIRGTLQEIRKKYGLRALQEEDFIPQMSILRDAWRRLKNVPNKEQ